MCSSCWSVKTLSTVLLYHTCYLSPFLSLPLCLTLISLLPLCLSHTYYLTLSRSLSPSPSHSYIPTTSLSHTHQHVPTLSVTLVYPLPLSVFHTNYLSLSSPCLFAALSFSLLYQERLARSRSLSLSLSPSPSGTYACTHGLSLTDNKRMWDVFFVWNTKVLRVLKNHSSVVGSCRKRLNSFRSWSSVRWSSIGVFRVSSISVISKISMRSILDCLVIRGVTMTTTYFDTLTKR